MKERAKFYELNKSKNFEEFKKKFLNLTNRLYCYGDYLRDVLGEALKNNKKEVEQICEYIKKTGGKIIFLDDSTKMVCNIQNGLPGIIEVDKRISIGGLKHEFRHYLDDIENGCPGIGYYLMDSDRLFSYELRGYKEELDLARKGGYTEVEDKILREIKRRKDEIYGIDT